MLARALARSPPAQAVHAPKLPRSHARQYRADHDAVKACRCGFVVDFVPLFVLTQPLLPSAATNTSLPLENALRLRGGDSEPVRSQAHRALRWIGTVAGHRRTMSTTPIRAPHLTAMSRLGCMRPWAPRRSLRADATWCWHRESTVNTCSPTSDV